MKINSFNIWLNKRNSLYAVLTARKWSEDAMLYDALYRYIVKYQTIANIDIEIPRIELEFLCDDIWKFAKQLKGRGGIYFLYDEEKNLCNIGSAVDLYKRIGEKNLGKNGGSKADYYFTKYYHSVTLFFEEDFDKRKLYEPYIINKLKPSLNFNFNYYDKSTYEETLAKEESEASKYRRPGLPSLGYERYC